MGFEISNTFIDDKAAENGVRVPFYDDAFLIIASTENPKYKAALAKSARANKIKLDGEPHPDTVRMTTQITCKAMSQHILLGWEGITLNGEPLPYSRETAYEMLMKSPQLREFVADQAGTDSLFNSIDAEDVAKNSTGSSDGAKAEIS